MLKVVHVTGAAPTWLTPKLFPAIVTFPDRAVCDVFACQDTVAVPFPLPLAGETVSQEPLPDVDHPPPWQPPGALPVTVTAVDPAFGEGVFTFVGAIENDVHGTMVVLNVADTF